MKVPIFCPSQMDPIPSAPTQKPPLKIIVKHSPFSFPALRTPRPQIFSAVPILLLGPAGIAYCLAVDETLRVFLYRTQFSFSGGGVVLLVLAQHVNPRLQLVKRDNAENYGLPSDLRSCDTSRTRTSSGGSEPCTRVPKHTTSPSEPVSATRTSLRVSSPVAWFVQARPEAWAR